jgi:hypothetical protein
MCQSNIIAQRIKSLVRSRTHVYYFVYRYKSLYSTLDVATDLTYLSLFVDSILERGTGTMPREIFQCPNVKSLSLKNNFLELLHPEVGKVFERDVYQN